MDIFVILYDLVLSFDFDNICTCICLESAGILELIQKISGANLPDSSTYTTIVALGGILGVGAYAVKYQKRIRNDLHNTGFAYIVSANKNGLLQPKNKLYI